MTSLGLSSSSDVITFDQNWHHLYSTSAGGKDLSNDTQIRVIGRMEPEMCTKRLKQLGEKLRAKFPATTPGYSKVIARLDKKKKEKKEMRRNKKIKNKKSKSLMTLVTFSQNFDFCACPRNAFLAKGPGIQTSFTVVIFFVLKWWIINDFEKVISNSLQHNFTVMYKIYLKCP